MMDKIKRHAFLIGLAAGVVVVSLAMLVGVYFAYWAPNSQTRALLKSTRTRANNLLTGPLYTANLVKAMADQVERRKKQYDELLDYIRSLGAKREPLVKNLFPLSTDISLRHSFKAEYDQALGRFMKRLGAIKPAVPTEKDAKDAAAELAVLRVENRKARMFADPKLSFFRPDWVDRQEAPSLDLVRYGQENIWLMEDLVEIIASTNEEILKATGQPPVITNAPIKELIEIRIGAEYATLSGVRMLGATGRYRPTGAGRARPGEKAEVGRAPTLSGRYSDPSMYRVLPWRLVVVADARFAGELVRRLKGRESFLSVEGWRARPITDAAFERGRDLLALERDDYGSHGVVRLEIIGESLAFQLEGGRITTVAKAAAGTPAAPGTSPAGEPATRTE